jgi:glycosyltransferase involved in cell wall biosynthesis
MRPSIVVLTQSGKGKGNALKCGFEAATGDIIATLDADGSTDPSELGNFIEPVLDGHDFAKGTRLARGRPPTMAIHRWIGNILIVGFANALFGTQYTDMCSGYNAFRRECLEKLHFSGDGYEDEPLIYTRAIKAKLNMVEVPCAYESRFAGESKSPAFRQAWKSFKTILREWLVWDNQNLLRRFQNEFDRMDKLVVRILGYLQV